MAVATFPRLASAVLPPGPVHLAIGMFDGVHQGHRAVIEPAVLAAKASGGTAAVLTFWPHPSALFRPADPTRLILPPDIKARLLGELGVATVVSEPFTRELAALPAADFLPWLKQQVPALAAVYVGENFRFGQKRAGDVALLERVGAALGLAVVSAPRVSAGGELVSSTRIRAHLLAGEIEAANALLGYPYFSAGPVRSGKRLGRTIGFPTLNQHWSPDLRPALGVYAVRVRGSAPQGSPGNPLPAVANYGLRPTVENATEPKLEIHVLGPCPYDTGDELEVEWLKFLRPEMKFAGLDALRTQIDADREAALRFFSQGRPASGV